MNDIETKLKTLNEKYRVVTFNGASCLITTVRRMKAEKEMDIPKEYRTGRVISVEHGKRANELAEVQWEKFYQQMCEELRKLYPDTHERMFGS